MKTFLNDKFWDTDWNIIKDYEARQKKKENDVEVRASIMVQILEDNQDTTTVKEDNTMLEKKYYEAYTLKDALEVIKELSNKNK
tara:strand:- start:1349 stop:1600 length:252 start_codon:yes stop_codon:yes gene_type:complete